MNRGITIVITQESPRTHDTLRFHFADVAAYWSGRGAYDGGRLWPATLDAASSITSGVVTFRITVPVLGSAVLSFLVYGGLAAALG